MVATVALIVACSTTPSTSTPSVSPEASAAPTTTAPAAVAPLKIGILIPFTEAALDADIGASQRRAADLYLKLQGGKLGGREIQLVYNDESGLDPKTNEVRIQQFLQTDHVQMLMGGASSAAAYLLRDAAEAARVVYIDTNASGNALTRTTTGCTPSCKSRFVFRTTSTSWQLGEPLGEWAAKSGLKDAYVVNADDAFGTESAAAFGEGLAKGGGKVTGRAAVAPHSGDWGKLVAAIKAQPTKTVFAAFITDDAEGFIDAWTAAGMRAAGYRLLAPGPFADAAVLKATKQEGIGITTAYTWSTELDNAENRSFSDEFKKAYRDDDTGQPLAPDGYAVEMWDAMRVLDEALKVTKGDATADALIAALEGVSAKTPVGPIAFDKTTHNPPLDVYIREVQLAGTALVNAVIDKIVSVKDPGQ
jgi:branched-chain amino acid transport system substrate-binding protein